MANAWIEHIRKFARDNGVTYACAFSNPKCIQSYRDKKRPSPGSSMDEAYAKSKLNEEIASRGKTRQSGRSGRTGEFSIIRVPKSKK